MVLIKTQVGKVSVKLIVGCGYIGFCCVASRRLAKIGVLRLHTSKKKKKKKIGGCFQWCDNYHSERIVIYMYFKRDTHKKRLDLEQIPNFMKKSYLIDLIINK